MNIQQELRDAAKKLLSEGGVDQIIGWSSGSLPMSSTPVFAAAKEEADDLIFDATCGSKLTVYFTKDRRQLAKDGKRTGVVVKGCDARSIVLSLKENQIKILLHFCPCIVVLKNIWSTHIPIHRCFKDSVTVKSKNCIKGFCINRI